MESIDPASPKSLSNQALAISTEARQPWEKIVQAHMTKCLQEDIYGVTHDETPTKTWVHHDPPTAGVQTRCGQSPQILHYHIEKTQRDSNSSVFGVSQQFNSYIKTLPCLYQNPSANQATKQVLPIDNAIQLHMCPAKWQTQYDLTEKTTPVNTGALLLILEKIENNTEVEAKPPA